MEDKAAYRSLYLSSKGKWHSDSKLGDGYSNRVYNQNIQMATNLPPIAPALPNESSEMQLQVHDIHVENTDPNDPVEKPDSSSHEPALKALKVDADEVENR